MGMKVEKAGGIEIYSAQNYLKTRNNWGVGGLLLHEYSHAYHYKHCANGYDNENILEVIFFYNFFLHSNILLLAYFVLYLFTIMNLFIFFMNFSAMNSFVYPFLCIFSSFSD